MSNDFDLRFHFNDTLFRSDVTRSIALDWMTGDSTVHAVIGCMSSAISDTMARAGGLFTTPEISWFSGSNRFTEDRTSFGFFMRTIAPMADFQHHIIAILNSYNWTSVTMFYSYDPYVPGYERDVFVESSALAKEQNIDLYGVQVATPQPRRADGNCEEGFNESSGQKCIQAGAWEASIQDATIEGNVVYVMVSAKENDGASFLKLAHSARLSQFVWIIGHLDNMEQGIASQSLLVPFQGALATVSEQDPQFPASERLQHYWIKHMDQTKVLQYLDPDFSSKMFAEEWPTNILNRYHIYLFDSVVTLQIAIGRLLKQYGSGAQFRGHHLLDEMMKVHFTGTSGDVAFNQKGDRIGMRGTLKNLQGEDWAIVGSVSSNGIDFFPAAKVMFADGSTTPPSGKPPTCQWKELFNGTDCVSCSSAYSHPLRHSAQCNEEYDSSEGVQVIVILITILIVVVTGKIVLCSWCGGRSFLRKRMKAFYDRPDQPNSATGKWVADWIGPVNYKNLVQDSDEQMGCRDWFINATPFTIKLDYSDNRPSRFSNLSTMGASSSSKSEASSSRSSSSKLAFRGSLNRVQFTLAPNTFNGGSVRNMRCFSLQLLSCKLHDLVDGSVAVNQDWDNFPSSNQTFNIEVDDWSKYPSEKDNDNFKAVGTIGYQKKLSYTDDVARKAVLNWPGGELKFTVCEGTHKRRLLVFWSPPHTLRGITFSDLRNFFHEVVHHQGVWTCRAADGTEIKRKKDDEERNMYDACTNWLLPCVATKDASYAELYGHLGAPTVFISHVWGTPAALTNLCIQNFSNPFRRKNSDVGSRPDRVWFCTVCNNQSRVLEELGSNAASSAFAAVISSKCCNVLAMVIPLKALKRKWCNYEFAHAKANEKRILLVTPEGIVQQGEVAPKYLCELSNEMRSFKCKDSECFSTHDSAYIDSAIDDMGGYDKLDTILQGIVRSAVEEAVWWASAANASWASEATDVGSTILGDSSGGLPNTGGYATIASASGNSSSIVLL